MKPILAYTVAFDRAHGINQRQMARMLGSSFTRTYFGGDFLIVHDVEHPIFLVEKKGIIEEFVDTSTHDDRQVFEFPMKWKAIAGQGIVSQIADDYSWIVFCDSDSIALRNIDHLVADVDDDVNILFQPEIGRSIKDRVFDAYLDPDERSNLQRDGINSGTFGIRSDIFADVMALWLEIQSADPRKISIWDQFQTQRHKNTPNWLEQGAWNRIVLDASKHGWKARPFEPHEIQFPLHIHRDWSKYMEACMLHCLGGTPTEKLKFLFGVYMQTFFFDDDLKLVDLLDM